MFERYVDGEAKNASESTVLEVHFGTLQQYRQAVRTNPLAAHSQSWQIPSPRCHSPGHGGPVSLVTMDRGRARGPSTYVRFCNEVSREVEE